MCIRREREKRVLEALAINSLDAVDPSERCMELLQSYSEGKSTIEERRLIFYSFLQGFYHKIIENLFLTSF